MGDDTLTYMQNTEISNHMSDLDQVNRNTINQQIKQRKQIEQFYFPVYAKLCISGALEMLLKFPIFSRVAIVFHCFIMIPYFITTEKRHVVITTST